MRPPEEGRPEQEWAARAGTPGRGPGWTVWLSWVGYTVLGRGLIATATSIRGPRDFGLTLMTGVLSPGVVALLQWLVLRRYLAGMRWWTWVLGTVAGQLGGTIGVALAGAVALVLGPRIVELIGASALRLLTGVVLGGLIGAGVGFAQWLLLRRYLAASVWWIPATFLAGAVVALVTGPSLGSASGKPATPLVVQLISGLIVGSITGTTLVWLLRKRHEVPITRQPSIR